MSSKDFSLLLLEDSNFTLMAKYQVIIIQSFKVAKQLPIKLLNSKRVM